MSDPTYRAYCKAQNAFFLCKDVSQLPALKLALDAAEKAYREAHPGAYYQAQQQVATLEVPADQAPVNEDR